MSHRSLRIGSSVTSLALEPAFWEEVDRRSDALGISWQEYVRQLLDEPTQIKNRAANIKQHLLVTLRDEKTALSTESETWIINCQDNEFEVETHQQRILVGRDKSNDIVIDDKQVSRKHLLFVFDDLHWWVLDLKSKNGTFLNGVEVVSKRLKRGDTVTTGETKIIKK
ncbi:FHA domain-containing protein [Alteromonas hispanica]|uniref:FHA domain-containing protein n=1 Tax=Alteromonas hispanica TaxID=315421 RepID=A0A6L9MSJ7_9ALTE|nr:FHA domain-containing protein [Alteromonas hispanica]NDW21189.1 FHA domain-containing protein [Alteromonas hispanica]